MPIPESESQMSLSMDVPPQVDPVMGLGGTGRPVDDLLGGRKPVIHVQPPADTSAVSDTSSITQPAKYGLSNESSLDDQGFGSPTVNAYLTDQGAQAQSQASPALAKQLDFDVGNSLGNGATSTLAAPTTPATPSLAQTPAPASGHSVSGEIEEGAVPDYTQFMQDTIMWTNRVRSTVYFLGGLLVLSLVNRALAWNMSLVSVLSYLLLWQMGLNFVRHFISPSLQERCTWNDSAWTASVEQYFGAGLHAVASLHDKHLSGSDPAKILKLGLMLWALSLLGRHMSVLQVVTACWFAAFSLPKAYSVYQERIHRSTNDIASRIKAQFLSVPPMYRAAMLVMTILPTGWLLSRTDLAIGMLLLAVYGRMWLMPSQVKTVQSRLAQITATASKMGGTISHMAANTAAKYELTPTPAKAKRA